MSELLCMPCQSRSRDMRACCCAGSTVVMDDVGEEDEEDIAAKARGCTAALALRGLLEGSCSLTRLSLAYTGWVLFID